MDEILLERVKNGNKKLLDTWKQSCDSEPEESEHLMKMIDKAWPRLNNLCLYLQASGFNDCLYGELFCSQNEERFCYVCPELTKGDNQ